MVVKNLLENKCLNVELGSLPLLQRWREAEEATAWDTVSAVNGLWRKVGKFYLLGRVTEKALIGRGEIKLVYTSLYCRHVVLQATADGLAELLLHVIDWRDSGRSSRRAGRGRSQNNENTATVVY